MKKVLLTITLLFSLSLYSQTRQDYLAIQKSILKTEKKVVVVENMNLTPEESDLFWPIYDEYNQKLFDVSSKDFDIILEYADSIDVMTDDLAKRLMNNLIKIETESLKLKKQYYKKFSAVLPATKVVRYFQIENKINALIEFELALEIPLIEVKD